MATLPKFLENLIARFVTAAIAAKGAIDDRNAARTAVVTAAIAYHRPDVVVIYDEAGKPTGGLMFQALAKARISLKPTTREIDQAKVVYDLLWAGEIGNLFAAKADADAAKADADAAKADAAEGEAVRQRMTDAVARADADAKADAADAAKADAGKRNPKAARA